MGKEYWERGRGGRGEGEEKRRMRKGMEEEELKIDGRTKQRKRR